ncbi:unnamed protein product [Bursaphelenchus xylophilus]|uniref:(pine wood nematode) hypothetical protein n=1 Tax=Bursaphelenchus xylophilus TaxID=6326 RepID=A0A811M353_BURXY|nr:unnamed protein product [Bursaphelenchus xylophilus]CAG9128249.1 unnamed protein product [Bursaphelenchus xylophilus]
MSDGYAVFFGLATIITSLIATLFLVVTVVAMIRSRLHRDKSAYRIMISQNLSDILQLIPHFFGGCALLFNKELDLTLNLRYKYVKAKRLKNKEQQILAQNVLSFMSTVGNMYAWNYQNSAKNQLLFAAIINLHWVAICGMTPFISFVMNSEIRAAVLSFLGRKPVSNQSVTVVSRFVTPTYG